METIKEQLKRLLNQKKSKGFYAERLGVTEDEINDILKELKKREEKLLHEDELEEEYLGNVSVNNDKGTLQSTTETTFEPRTDRELAELHKIDLNKYKISNYWSKRLPNNKFTSSVFCTLLTAENSIEKQKDIILKELQNYSPKTELITRLKSENSPSMLLLEISIPDMHIGKLAHKSETGEDYDLQIAVKRYKKAVAELLDRVQLDSIGRILLPIGNDLINIDNENLTTVAGTPQDCDSRFSKMVQITKELLIDTITQLSIIAPVDVIVVKGNHDSTVTFMIGEILKAYFHNNPNIMVDNSPKWRKYYKFGEVGILYTHGDKEKHSDLGLIFATEEPRLWADTKYRFAKLGHLHKAKTTNYIPVNTENGFQIQILPSLSATDEWHYSKGYLGLKQCKAFLYHKTKGEIASYTYTV